MKQNKATSFFAAFFFTAFTFNMAAVEPRAKFILLDKITARREVLLVSQNTPTQAGKLTIKVRKLYKSSPEEAPENAAYFTVYDNLDEKQVFEGWMYSSAPAIHTLTHPVYSLWLVDIVNCDKEETTKTCNKKAPSKEEA